MDHYFSEKPTSEETIFKIAINVDGLAFEMLSASGLFSKDALDTASKLLIENAKISGTKGLDLGCGNGVIGICIIKKHPATEMVFSDINERAVKICEKNINKLRLKGKVIKSDLFEKISGEFDFILSNPPYAAGRDVCFKLIEDSFNYLRKRGTLQIVARHNKGGKILSEKMKNVFGNVETLAKSGGFRVYMSVKN